ncbi:MAG: hypothetical protein Q8N81_04915 [bacterium]|nr:hypothetical protein [bacterium]
MNPETARGAFEPIPEGTQEREKQETPKMTLFLLRHGESESDKTKPNRGLTELGQDQVREALAKIVNQVALEEKPDAQNLPEALSGVEFHLRDSGTERTLEQVWLEHDLLVRAGVPEESINLPESALKYKGLEKKSGPGAAKRLKGVQGLDLNPAFRKKMKDPAFQAEVGASTDMEAWALAPEDQVPQGVETLAKMQERYRRDIAKAERLVPRLTAGSTRRIVTIANSHASIATLAASSELGIPMDQLMKKIGEIPGAEGLRFDFYGTDKAHATKPFGPQIEKAVAEMKEE